MRRLFLAALLVASYCLGNSQNRAETGSFQLKVPSDKHVQSIQLDNDLLEEIESLRLEDEDRETTLENGLKVLVISRRSFATGRRVMQWKLEPKQ